MLRKLVVLAGNYASPSILTFCVVVARCGGHQQGAYKDIPLTALRDPSTGAFHQTPSSCCDPRIHRSCNFVSLPPIQMLRDSRRAETNAKIRCRLSESRVTSFAQDHATDNAQIPNPVQFTRVGL
jgi:hypothetical protein